MRNLFNQMSDGKTGNLEDSLMSSHDIHDHMLLKLLCMDSPSWERNTFVFQIS